VNLPTQKEKVEFLEQELWNDMGSFPNFIPHIQLHEFETLLFSSKDGFNGNVANPALVLLCNIVEEYSNPEDINEGETTAPSKRILVAYPSYEKIWEGNLMAIDVGIELMKSKCPHFSDWLEKIRIYGK
jgi:hypothetical protein